MCSLFLNWEVVVILGLFAKFCCVFGMASMSHNKQKCVTAFNLLKTCQILFSLSLFSSAVQFSLNQGSHVWIHFFFELINSNF